MPDPGLLGDVLDGGYLLVAFVVALVGSLLRPARVHLALAVGLAVGGLAWSVEVLVPALAAALAGAALSVDGPRISRVGLGQVAMAVGGAGALYACVPDTERARALLGATAACSLVVVQLRRPWRRGLVATAVATAAIALFDGAPRPSSQLAGIGIAVVLACGRFGPGPRPAARAALGLVALGALSRVIGLSEATDWPALAATAVTAVAVAGTRALGRDPDQLDDIVAPPQVLAP